MSNQQQFLAACPFDRSALGDRNPYLVNDGDFLLQVVAP